MSRLVWGVLLAMLVGCGDVTQDAAERAATATDTNEIVTPSRVFTGIVSGNPTLDQVRRGIEEVFEPLTVIEDEARFQKFLTELPREMVSMSNPAPENEDPLLKGATVDFEKETMIVLRWNRLTPPMCKMVRKRQGKQEVWVEYVDDRGARPYGTGAYTALVVDRFRGDTVLTNP